VPGAALIGNVGVGDLLQLVSNDRFKSVGQRFKAACLI
jgi:hypothetical protein